MPKYLWIGRSDRRISANMTMGLKPDELFVHRNIAVVARAGMNCLSVNKFADEAVGAEHIVVCVHDNCRGVLEKKREFIQKTDDSSNFYGAKQAHSGFW